MMAVNAPPPSPLRNLAVAFVLLAGCEQVVDSRRDLTPHEAYVATMEDTGLDGSGLGRNWIEAAAVALSIPLSVPLPYREGGSLQRTPPLQSDSAWLLVAGRCWP